MIAKIRDNYGDNFDQMMIPKKQNAGLAQFWGPAL